MNRRHLIKPVIAAGFMLLAACVNQNDLIRKQMQQGFVPYIPPQGNPTNYAGWNNYGPGMIIDAKGYNSQRSAERDLGKAEVKRIMMEANDAANRTPYAALSNHRTSGSDFDGAGGWSLSAAANVKASLNLDNASTIDLKFGNTWVSAPFDYEGLRSALKRQHVVLDPLIRKRLNSGQSHLIFKTIYTDSITIYFKTSRSGGGEASLDIPTQEQAKLGGHFKIESDGGVTVPGAIMLGYVPVPRQDLPEVLP